MQKLIFVLLLLLAACSDPSPREGNDGYYMQPTERLAERPIKFNLVNSDRALWEAYANTKGGRELRHNEQLFGFTTITKDECTITIVDPAITYRPEQLGHEVAHCLYGAWHPDQNEVRG
jgi:hypothetical protein